MPLQLIRLNRRSSSNSVKTKTARWKRQLSWYHYFLLFQGVSCLRLTSDVPSKRAKQLDPSTHLATRQEFRRPKKTRRLVVRCQHHIGEIHSFFESGVKIGIVGCPKVYINLCNTHLTVLLLFRKKWCKTKVKRSVPLESSVTCAEQQNKSWN